MSVVKRNDSWEVKRFLNSHPNVEFAALIDNKSSTVLHLAGQNNNLDVVELFLKLYEERQKEDLEDYNQERKRRWLNLKDADGFSCLHYAVYRANYKMALVLEHNGADIYQINALGLCVMHIAAQGDSPLLLVPIDEHSSTTI